MGIHRCSILFGHTLGSEIRYRRCYLYLARYCWLGYVAPAFDILLDMLDDKTASWIFMFISYSFKGLGIESCFTGITLLTKHTVPQEIFGIAQGISGSCFSIGLAIGPLWAP